MRANPAMEYREQEVPAGLRRYVECIWILRDGSSSDRTQAIFPDGRCELIAHRAPPPRAWDAQRGWHVQAPLIFAAQHRQAIRLASTGVLHCLGVRLAPAASALIAGPRLAGLRDQTVDLGALDAGFARMFFTAAMAALERGDTSALLQCLSVRFAAFPLDERIEAAVERLERCDGQERVEALAAAVGMSTRNLQLRFLASVGLTVKEFARVLRLQATIRALDAEAAAISQVASGAGFADQAHATRELRRTTGSTPARLRAALRAAPDGDETLRLAAAFVRGHASTRR